MMIHVDKNVLAEWQEYFGNTLENALTKAIECVDSREIGDSLDVYITFKPKLKPKKFSIKHDEPKCGGNAYIYVIAE